MGQMMIKLIFGKTKPTLQQEIATKMELDRAVVNLQGRMERMLRTTTPDSQRQTQSAKAAA